MNKLFYGLLCVIFILATSCQKDNHPIEEDISPADNSTELTEKQVQNMLFSYIQTVEKNNLLTRSKTTLITNITKAYHESQKVSTRANAINGKIPIYTINLKCGDQPGFAIVVGDKRIPVVLAYSPQADLSKLKNADGGGVQSYIANVPTYVDEMIEQYNSSTYPDLQNKFTEFYNDPEHSTPDYTYSWTDADGTQQELHFLRETIIWQQDAPYNEALPYCVSRRQHYLVGCSALALANIMAYKEYPSRYNWKLITEGLTLGNSDSKEKKDAVTGLLKDLFEATKTKYDSIDNVSLASGNNTYMGLARMGYCCDAMAYWNLAEIGKSIKRNHPVWMGGTCKNEMKQHAHAFVIRGWWKFKLPTQSDTEYGVSLGVNWGNDYGFGNGWYLVQYEGLDVQTLGLAPLLMDDQGHVYAKHDYKNNIQYLLNIRPNEQPLE